MAALQPANNLTSCAASRGFRVSEIKAVCRDLGCSVNDFLTTVFTTSLSKAMKGQSAPKEGSMWVCVNIRDPPASQLEMRQGKNMLHLETINYPISQDFKASLARISGQMNDFKCSNRHYVFHYFSKMLQAVVPRVFEDPICQLINSCTSCVTMTNIMGPQAPLRIGNEAQSQSVMFFNFYPRHYHYVQFYVFTHCEELKVGYVVSQMDLDCQQLMAQTEETIKQFILQWQFIQKVN